MRAALAILLGLAGIAAGAVPTTAVTAATAVGPIRLAMAVPLVVPAGTTGLISAPILAQYTGPLGALTRALDEVINRPVAIGIDPMIIASIRVLGSSAPVSAVAWLDRLASASNQTFPLSYADSDLSLSTQAGNTTMLEPQSFDFAIDPSLFAVRNSSSPTPPTTTGTTKPALPPFPTTASLLAWPYSMTGIAWPRENSLVASDPGILTAAGYTATILDSANVARAQTAGGTLAVDGATVLVSESPVSLALRAAAGAPSPEAWQAAMTRLSEVISTVGRAQSVESPLILATLDRSVSGLDRLAQSLDAIAALASVTTVPLSTALRIAPAAATVIDKPQDPDRLAQVALLLAAEAAEEKFATVAVNPEAVTAPRRLAVLALLSVGWSSDPGGWSKATASFLSQSGDIRAAVKIVASSSYNLLADRATLPIDISNALDQAVTVYITVRPDTALLAVGDSRVKLVIEPRSQGKGQIPVQAISNGSVQITVSLSNSAGLPIGSPAAAQINVQAGWETPAVIFVAVLVVLVFAGGILRNILRQRSRGDD